MSTTWTDAEYDKWMNGGERWMPFHDIGLTCPSCGARGMKPMGERLYRCEQNGCPSRGDTRLLVVRNGFPMTVPLGSALALGVL